MRGGALVFVLFCALLVEILNCRRYRPAVIDFLFFLLCGPLSWGSIVFLDVGNYKLGS